MKRATSPKKEALAAIGAMSDNAGWEEIFYELYVRQKLQAGIDAADAQRVRSHEEVKRRFRRNP